MKRILIAGGTGLIGKRLVPLLQAAGHEIRLLSRRVPATAKTPTFRWDLLKGYIDPAALEGVDVVINLAGAGIADKRWTAARKKLLIESRTQSQHLFARLIGEGRLPAKAYIAASAVGYYGDRGDELMTEESPPSKEGFLAECTVAWENAIQSVADTGLRTVVLRIGIVLDTEGGALEKMLIPFRFGMGNWFGDGQQYYSWIHADDMCRIIAFAVSNEKLQGHYNAVAPQPCTNKALIQAIKKVRDKPALMMPVPAFTLRLGMGEMADMILGSTRVSSRKIEEAGFQFTHTHLVKALRDLGV